jgi:hypothetical protein
MLDEQPSKDDKGNVVDNLVAQFTSTVETLVEAATDSYLSTVTTLDEDDEDDEDDSAEGDAVDAD